MTTVLRGPLIGVRFGRSRCVPQTVILLKTTNIHYRGTRSNSGPNPSKWSFYVQASSRSDFENCRNQS